MSPFHWDTVVSPQSWGAAELLRLNVRPCDTLRGVYGRWSMVRPGLVTGSGPDCGGGYVQAVGLGKWYRGRPVAAVEGCSVAVGRGELVAVVGHNGAGKSTLFEMLCGLSRPDDGCVRLGIDAAELGWCPQREIIDWSLTVGQNITVGLELRRNMPRRQRREAVVKVAGVLGLAEFLGRTAESLSGGQLRRTQIARAMAGDPMLMILDEPTTGLDPAGIRAVFGYLQRRREAGASALISTHETSRFAHFCTRVIALRSGRIIADEPQQQFMSHAPGSDDLWDAYEAVCR